MQSVIRIGSRESRLAVKQAEIIKDQIRRCDQTILVEIITMKTTGDKILDRSLESVGGKGLFVKELDQALADGRIDLAVHSLKDMPMEESSEFPILAYSRREDPRDVLIYKSEKKEQGTEEGSILTKTGAVIGTSSKRRMIQIQKLYPNAVFQGIRGNIQTRLSKLNKEEYDAAVLAAAGVKRLNMEAVIGRYFSVDEVIPAAGQGILAVQGRKEFLKDTVWRQYVDDKKSRVQALAERSFIRVLDGGCTSPSAAYAQSSEPQPETAPSPAETEAEPETQNPFTPDGTGTVVDNATDEDGKEFYTITTADESVFYLVIDKQKTSENVYFLNTVTVDDLLPLAEQGKEPPKEVTPEPEPKPTEPVEEIPDPEPEKKDSPLLSLLLIGAVVLAGGGIGYYFKIYKPKHEAPDLEDDYCEYEDGELEEIAEEPEDEDTPPWEEDTEE